MSKDSLLQRAVSRLYTLREKQVVDEDESEMTLSFWYLFQEALWNSDYGFDYAEDGDEGQQGVERERDMMPVAKAVYMELVSVLRRKVVWPPRAVLNGWPRGK